MKERYTFKTIGSDPEFFLRDEMGNYIPGSKITEGDKVLPEFLERNDFALFRDNLTIEGNIAPAYDLAQFKANMLYLMEIIKKRADSFGLKLIHTGEAKFDDQYINSKEGQESGCSSISYAWESQYFQPFKSVVVNTCNSPRFGNSPYRTAGFHIHIGYSVANTSFEDKLVYDTVIAKLFDLFISLPALQIVSEPYREKKYGLLGNFRDKEYGIECRTLSSYFTNPIYYDWIWNQISLLFDYLNDIDEEVFIQLLNLNTTKKPTAKQITNLFSTIIPNTKEIVEEFSTVIKNYTYV